MKIGDKVRLVKLPTWLHQLPVLSQNIFHHCLYGVFDITAIEEGVLVLDVSWLVDNKFGGWRNDIRVEPEYVIKEQP